jgi:hypothetical protein
VAQSDIVRVILPSTTAAASSTGSELNIVEPFTSAIIWLDITAASGTSPTLNVRIQEVINRAASTDTVLSMPSSTKLYDDFAAFAQATGTGQQVMRIVGGGNTVNTISSGALAASTIRNGPIGSIWRVQYTIGGTNPSYPNLYMIAQVYTLMANTHTQSRSSSKRGKGR